MGLLRFYTEEFDFKEYVISIRQKKLLTTFEKQWTSKCIAIEGNNLADIQEQNKTKTGFIWPMKLRKLKHVRMYKILPFDFYQFPSLNL